MSSGKSKNLRRERKSEDESMEDEPTPPKRKRGRPSEKSKKALQKSSSEESKDQEMEEAVPSKVTPFNSKHSESKKSASKKLASSIEEEKKDVDMEVSDSKSTTKPTRDSKKEKEQSKSKTGKRQGDSKLKHPDSKRKKTEKSEKSVTSDKKKPKKIDWQYGRHCVRDHWVGKKAKVKFPAQKDGENVFKVGTITGVKEDSKGYKNIFEVDFENEEKKWIDLNDLKLYVFGQILSLRYTEENSQLGAINGAYKFKVSEGRVPLSVPVIELIEADVLSSDQQFVSQDEPVGKVPIQWFNSDHAKKILPDYLQEFNNFSEEEDKIIAKQWGKGEETVQIIKEYYQAQNKWVNDFGCVELNPNESFSKHVGKVVRIFKDGNYSNRALILR